jgi:hypothetical protein
MAKLSDAVIEAAGFPVSAERNGIQAVVIPLRTVPATFLIIVHEGAILTRKGVLPWQGVARCLNAEGFPPDFDGWEQLEDG